jgi:acyl-CoA synthetase (AMP-forming)/AMP-acid ligase II
MTIPGLVAWAAERHSGVWLDGDDGVVTFAQLPAVVQEVARGLAAAGVAPGDRVGLWAPNRCRWPIVALAALRLGAVIVPLSTRAQPPELLWITERARVRLIVAERGFRADDPLAPLVAGGVRVLDLDGPGYDLWVAAGRDVPADALSWRALPDDPSDVLFTSGTTGRAKGVCCTHAQAVRAYSAWADTVGLVAGDRMLGVVPFFHAFGYKAGWLACLIVGATMVPHRVFDAGLVDARVRADRITVLTGPPTLFHSLLRLPGRSGPLGVRLAVTGAASIPVSLIVAMREDLGINDVHTGYGLTEACGVATLTRAGDPPAIVASTSGRAIPGVEVVVVDAAGAPVAAGEPGEVLIRGYNVMLGYLDDPVATAEVMAPGGWLRTGDVGVLDAAGNLRITDRIKDMLIVGGFKVFPAEVEATMLDLPGVADVAVVGAPDERLGEIPVAFVVPAPGEAVDAVALTAQCRARLSGYKVPRAFIAVDALPRNASGKVTRHTLRERVKEQGWT